MEKVVLDATVRTTISKGSRSELRKAKRVPGILYSKAMQPVPVAVHENAINPLVFTAETHIINVKLDDSQQYDCILKDVQFDPVTDRVVHFDLQGLISGETIQIEVPVVIKGSAIGVREGGLLQQLTHRVLCECLPSDIPEHIEIDVTNLKLGHAVHVRDLNIPNISFMVPPESVLVTVNTPRSAETTAAAEGEEKAEPEVITKGKEKSEE